MHKSQIFILPMLVSVSFLVIGTGCGKSTTAAAVAPPLEVRVAGVEQRDVPLYKKWIGTLDGFVNADIKAQVAGYLTQRGPRSTWSLLPQVTQPIFTAGRIKSTVKFSEAGRQRALIHYEKTIQTAFTEVHNALIAHQRVRESRERQVALVTSLEDRVRLAYLRYRGGVDTQLNALDADRDLFQAKLDLARIRLDEVLTVVHLYNARGGGWQ